MPDLNQLPVPQYSADQPYHWEYDNLPLKTLADRDLIINNEVDSQGKILRESSGTQGTLANRLAQSIDPDGNLIPVAVDQSLHNIAEHSDGVKNVFPAELANYVALGFPDLVNPVPFVRMLASERDKLALIANEATNMTIAVETISNIVLFEEGPVEFAASESIVWEVEAPNKVRAVLAVSTEFAHRHYYDLTPVMVPTADLVPILNKLFKVTSTATPYIEDSLRVYINGIRLNPNENVYYPSNPVSIWKLNKFTPDHLNGLFILESPITDDDIIQIDFDESLT
jgi:hypothetical protein